MTSTKPEDMDTSDTNPRFVDPVRRVAKAIALRAALTNAATGTEEWYMDLARAALSEMTTPGSDTKPGRKSDLPP